MGRSRRAEIGRARLREVALRQAVEVDARHRWRKLSATLNGSITGLIADVLDVEMVVRELGLADGCRWVRDGL